MVEPFDPFQIANLRSPNRLVRSATNMRLAGPQGEVSEELLEVYRKLAQGGVGLCITGHAYVSAEGKVSDGQLGIWDDRLIDGLKKLVEAFKAEGGLIFVQLSHGGALAFKASGERLSPSPFKGAKGMSLSEVERVKRAFIEAAKRAKKAGFDGIELHGAHGYLLSCFLSPKVNRRKDRYGGREGGTRFIAEIISGIKEETGLPLIIKLGPDNGEGNTIEDIIESLKELRNYGLDGVEISRGLVPQQEIMKEGIKPYENEAYNLPYALKVKEKMPHLPVILVGGIRSYETSKEILSKGIDALAFSRPLIREPHLPLRWKQGDRRPSTCRSCNLCFNIREPIKCRA